MSRAPAAALSAAEQARIEAVLQYMLRPDVDACLDLWFGKSATTDAEIALRFGTEVLLAERGALDHWATAHPRALLALVVLLDQFPRNIYRNTPRMYASDKRCRGFVKEALKLGVARAFTPIEPALLGLVLTHSEQLSDQLDRLDGILDVLADALPQAVADACKEGARQAMKEAVQAVTGLIVNYYVLIDLQGFRSMIDAVGGIDVVVTSRVPIGGGTSPIHSWIEPGRRHLNGFHALWYGRSREGSSDYERMARQRCVMTAMVNQLDPPTLLRKFQGIAAAGQQVVSTDIPAGQLPEFVTLGQQAKSHRIDSVQFVPPLIVPHHPDYAVIRSKVAQAVAASGKGLDPSPTAVPQPTKAGKERGKATEGQETPVTPGPTATTPGQPVVDVRQVCKAA